MRKKSEKWVLSPQVSRSVKIEIEPQHMEAYIAWLKEPIGTHRVICYFTENGEVELHLPFIKLK